MSIEVGMILPFDALKDSVIMSTTWNGLLYFLNINAFILLSAPVWNSPGAYYEILVKKATKIYEKS